jgi:hypothetical protein
VSAVPNRPPIPRFWWPIWMAVLVVALIVFYGFFTPAWIGIRAVAALSERSRRSLDGRRQGSAR